MIHGVNWLAAPACGRQTWIAQADGAILIIRRIAIPEDTAAEEVFKFPFEGRFNGVIVGDEYTTPCHAMEAVSLIWKKKGSPRS